MIKRRVLSTVALAISGVLVGCGGGNSDTNITVTKVVTDDPVSGLNYHCSSDDKVKKTNTKGEFTCNKGDSVTFLIGTYKIGSVDTNEGSVDTLRIADLGLSYGAATDIRQILQTINDSAVDGVITIPDNFDKLKKMDKKPGDKGFDDEATKKLDKELVSEEEANAKALLSGIKQILAGKTLYHIQGSKIDLVKFTADMKSYFEGEDLANEHKITIENNNFVVDGMIITIGEVNEQYIEITIGDNKELLFFEKSNTEKFLKDSTKPDSIKSSLAGKSFYIVDDNKVIKIDFASDMTSLVADSHTAKISFDNGTYIYHKKNGETATIALGKADDKSIIIYMIDKKGVYHNKALFFKKSDASSYFAEQKDNNGSANNESNSEIQKLLAGKTLYHIQGSKIDLVKFTADMKSYFEGENLANEHKITIENNNFVVGGMIITIGEVNKQYLEIIIGDNKELLFFSKSDAEQYIKDNTKPDSIKSALAGKSFYIVDDNKVIKIDFASDMTSFVEDSHTVKISFDNDIYTYHKKNGETATIALGKADDKSIIIYTVDKEGVYHDIVLFFKKSDADSYLEEHQNTSDSTNKKK